MSGCAAMNDIVAQECSVTQLIGEIGAASLAQSGGIGEVSGAVAALDPTTQQNAALVAQSTAAAEGSKAQAAQLAEAVRVFRLQPA